LSRRRAILADDMGLGKTRTAIVAAREADPDGPFLVICPASVKLNWRREIEMVEPDADVQVVTGASFEPGHRWTVVNYDLVNRNRVSLTAAHWAVAVVDEAHYVKNDSVRSKRTLELLGVLAGSTAGPDHVYLLTGTPMANRPRDLFNLLKAVRHPLANSFYRYAKRYCAAFDNGYGLDTNGAANVDELAAVVSGVMLRRTKRDALDLPEKVRSWLPVELPLSRIRSVEKRALDYLRTNPARAGETWITFLGLLNRARHDLAVTKARSTADFVGDCVEADQKVVVFTAYNGAVDLLRERFADRCVVLTGADSAEARQAAVDRFQSDERVRVFIGNLHAAGVGITLTAATHVVFNDLDWVPANHWQAEDRIHRIGQTKGTLATYLYAPGTLDDYVAALLEQKAQIIAELEAGAGEAASLVEQVVARAIDGDDASGAHEPASAPRPTMGLLQETLELLARLRDDQLSQHTGEAVFTFPSSRDPSVIYTATVTNGVATCDCKGFTYGGNCKHAREAARRAR
jgi:SWI/SNF-related matrix-associated actin-dependent regulator 1 of chromatin subfamily A